MRSGASEMTRTGCCSTMIDYALDPENPVPGSYEHRGMDCPEHGPNVVFFRLYKSTGPYHCVKCSLLAMSRRYDEELSRTDE